MRFCHIKLILINERADPLTKPAWGLVFTITVNTRERVRFFFLFGSGTKKALFWAACPCVLSRGENILISTQNNNFEKKMFNIVA